MKNYQVDRKCTDCGFAVKATLTKQEAAFQLFDTNKLFGTICAKCGGNNSSSGFTMPILDRELLSEWTQNEGLYFLSQDEELILGTGQYFDLIVEALDNPQTLLNKKYVLLNALCVIIYDNSVGDGSEFSPDNELKFRVIDEIKKRKVLLIQAGDWIMDYIKKVVYPQLNAD